MGIGQIGEGRLDRKHLLLRDAQPGHVGPVDLHLPRPESRPHWRRRSASGRGPGPSLHRRRTPGRSRTGTDSPAAGTTGTSPGPGCRLNPRTKGWSWHCSQMGWAASYSRCVVLIRIPPIQWPVRPHAKRQGSPLGHPPSLNPISSVRKRLRTNSLCCVPTLALPTSGQVEGPAPHLSLLAEAPLHVLL